MKKIKMMLMSLALFAVVGGALAFKAKFEKSICYTQASAYTQGLKCPNTFNLSTIDESGTTTPYFTVLSPDGTCPADIECGNVAVSLKRDF